MDSTAPEPMGSLPPSISIPSAKLPPASGAASGAPSYSDILDLVAHSLAPAADRFAQMTSLPPPKLRQKPVGIYIASVGAIAFGAALAMLLGSAEPEPPPVSGPPTSAPVAAAFSYHLPEAEESGEEAEVAAEREGERQGEGQARRDSAPSPSGAVAAATHNGEAGQLGERGGVGANLGGIGSFGQSRRRAVRMDEGNDAVTESRVRSSRRGPVRRSSRNLDPAQVRAVVRAGQPRLRLCYTRAMRSSGEGRDALIDLTIHIAPSGEVSAVDYVGANFGGLASCIRGVIGRWEFPASRRGGEVPLPLRFTAL